MKQGHRWIGWALVVGTAALLAIPSLAVLPQGTAATSSTTARAHVDPAATLDAALETTRAFLEEDTKAARLALDRLKATTPPLNPDRDEESFGSEIVSFNQAYHITLDRSREYATAGRLEDAFNQFVWVERACFQCHAMARERGLLGEDTAQESE